MSAQTLLVEVRTEELPPLLLQDLSESFARLLRGNLVKAGYVTDSPGAQGSMDSPIAPTPMDELAEGAVSHGVMSHATPRRLAALVGGVLPVSESDGEQLMRGPSRKVAYDGQGRPTKALEGFLRSAAKNTGNGPLTTDDLVEVEHKDETYVAVKKRAPVMRASYDADKNTWETSLAAAGATLAERIGDLVAYTLSQISAPRLMRWGAGQTRFVRPVHGLTVVHGPRTLAASAVGMAATPTTFGHRFLSPGEVTIAEAGDYAVALEKAKVLVDHADRVNSIARQARQAAPGVDLDEDLLDEVANMCEWPVCYACGFDRRYLELPELVVTTCMKTHVRCFPVYDADALSPLFVYVADNEPATPDKLVRGVERVMRARLDDALFIYDEDRKLGLDDLLAKTAGIHYMGDLGSVRDRAKRLVSIATSYAAKFRLDEKETKAVAEAASLCDADLGTLVVAEMPELRGYMAATYLGELGAISQRAGDLVADLPLRQLDAQGGDAARDCLVATTEMERAVAVACTQGLPSGSADPFGLRRCLVRVLRVLSRHPGVDMGELADIAATAVRAARPGVANEDRPGGAKDSSDVTGDVLRAALMRLESQSQDLFGLDAPADTRAVRAVLELWARTLRPDETIRRAFDVADMKSRLAGVQALITQGEKVMEDLVALSKRLGNIGDGSSDARYDVGICEEVAERRLHEQYQSAASEAGELAQRGDHQGALRRLAKLRGETEGFFDGVLVNTDDAAQRANRHALVSMVRDLVENLVCDINWFYRGGDWRV